MKVSITVVRKLPTTNEMRRKYRHWAVYKTLRDTWQREMFALLGSKNVKLLREKKDLRLKVAVTVTAERKRLADDDGNVGGAKHVFDALKRLELCVDDSPEWMVQNVAQYKGNTPRTMIEIEPLEG